MTPEQTAALARIKEAKIEVSGTAYWEYDIDLNAGVKKNDPDWPNFNDTDIEVAHVILTDGQEFGHLLHAEHFNNLLAALEITREDWWEIEAQIHDATADAEWEAKTDDAPQEAQT